MPGTASFHSTGHHRETARLFFASRVAKSGLGLAASVACSTRALSHINRADPTEAARPSGPARCQLGTGECKRRNVYGKMNERERERERERGRGGRAGMKERESGIQARTRCLDNRPALPRSGIAPPPRGQIAIKGLTVISKAGGDT